VLRNLVDDDEESTNDTGPLDSSMDFVWMEGTAIKRKNETWSITLSNGDELSLKSEEMLSSPKVFVKNAFTELNAAERKRTISKKKRIRHTSLLLFSREVPRCCDGTRRRLRSCFNSHRSNTNRRENTKRTCTTKEGLEANGSRNRREIPKRNRPARIVGSNQQKWFHHTRNLLRLLHTFCGLAERRPRTSDPLPRWPRVAVEHPSAQIPIRQQDIPLFLRQSYVYLGPAKRLRPK
jgi:hypothetical protein